MRQTHVRSLLLLLLVLLVASSSVVVVPVEVRALGGICGGATPCECGDILIASRTLVSGVDSEAHGFVSTVTGCVRGIVSLRISIRLPVHSNHWVPGESR